VSSLPNRGARCAAQSHRRTQPRTPLRRQPPTYVSDACALLFDSLDESHAEARQMGRTVVFVPMVELDPQDCVCSELRGTCLEQHERGVLSAHLRVNIDDADNLGEAIDVRRLKHEDAL